MTRKLALILFLIAPSAFAQTSTVTWTNVHQTMDGWGAQTWGYSDNVSSTVADQFFSPTAGIGLSYVRTQVPFDNSIPDLATLQLATARGAKIWLELQSPPCNLKYTFVNEGQDCTTATGSNFFTQPLAYRNGDVSSNGTCFTSNQPLATSYATYANDVIATLNQWNSAGVPVNVLGVTNEPNIGPDSLGFCNWGNGTLVANFIDVLAPMLNSAHGLTAPVPKLLMPQPFNDDMATWATPCANDATCNAAVSIYATHGYGYPFTPTAYPQGIAGSHHFWLSETGDQGGYDGSISAGLVWATNIHGWLTVANVSAANWWSMAYGGPNATTCPGLANGGIMSCDFATQPKRFYVEGQWSKFVRTGWQRIDTTINPQAGIFITAFKDPVGGGFAIMAVNTNTSGTSCSFGTCTNQTFSLSGFPAITGSLVTPWITSSGQNLAQNSNVTGVGSSFSYALPTQSVTTFVGTTSGGSLGTLSLAPTSLSFGTVTRGTSSSGQVITATNTGSGSVTFSSFSFSGADYTQTNNCGATLAGGANCQVTVTFSPTATAGTIENANLNIAYTGGVNSPATATLSGTSGGSGQLWSGIIAPARAMDWSQAGLPGSILPDASWPVCATIAPYTGNGSTITAALAACKTSTGGTGGVVVLAAGTFSLCGGIGFPADQTGHLALRGQGANSTFLNFTCATGGPTCNGRGAYICMGGSDGTYCCGNQIVHNWTGGYAQGSTQITLDSVSSIVPGLSILILNQCDTGFSTAACTTGSPIDNGGYFRCQQHWSSAGVGCAVPSEGGTGGWRANASAMEGPRVVAINQGGCGATCVTLSQPIELPDWNSGQSPQAIVMNGMPMDGVENLAIVDMSGGQQNGIFTNNSQQVWISGVKVVNSYANCFSGLTTFHSLIKDSYCYGNPGGYGDNAAIRLINGANNLVQNNISQASHDFLINDASPEQGDVYAYNLAVNPYTITPPTCTVNCTTTDPNLGFNMYAHGAGDYMELFEGNVGNSMVDDADHGGHLNQTRFRNFLTGWVSCANGQCGTATSKSGFNTVALATTYGTRYSANIANVLGTPGFHTGYFSNACFAAQVIYILGCGNGNGGPQPTDTLTASTMLRWGNWDNVTNATRWCGNSSDTGWATTCASTSEVPTGAPTYPNPVPTLGDTGAGQGALPASFYLASKPSWFGSLAWPPIGPDVSGGNVGQCTGTPNTTSQAGVPSSIPSKCGTGAIATAWGGHVNAIPAMNCFLNVMGGVPDGTGPVLPFDATTCYAPPAGAAIAFTPPSVAFGNVNVGSTSPGQVVKVTNPGSALLNITNFAMTGTNPADFSQSNNCAGGVAAGGSCNVTVTCTPASAASFSASLSVTDNAPASPQTIPLTCTGVTASAGISFVPTSVAFAAQAVGTSSSPTAITVTNTGGATLTITSVSIIGGNNTSFSQTNNCTSVAPSGTCTINVTFSPQVAGALSSSVCATDNAAGSPQCVPLSGTGNGTAGIGFSPTSLAFGNQTVSTTSSALSVTVSNTGTATLTLTSETLTGTNAADFAVSANTCGGTLAVGATCVVSVTFTPGATGARTANLTFTNSAAGSPQNVALSGTGTQAGISFTPTGLTFANQNVNTTSPPQTITITNTGSATLTISSIAPGANPDYAISSNVCGATLAPSATCTVSITFTPSTTGTRNGSISVTDNAPGSPQLVLFHGTGVNNVTALTVAPSSLSFPATVVGQPSASQAVTVTNTSSSSPVTFTSIVASGDFSQANNCGASLAGSTTCQVNVTFTPSVVGSRTGSLVLTDNASNSPQSVALSGTGTQSGAQVSPSSINFGSQPVSTTSAAQNVTLTNNGTATLNVASILLGGTNPSYFAISANTCGSTLAVSAVCTVSLTFTPQTAISSSATLSFTDDGPGSPQVVTLSGLGTFLAFSFNPTSLAFGSVNVGTTSPTQAFTIANNGNGVATISGITIIGTNAGDFSQTNNCPPNLSGGGSCTVSVKFLPTASGARSASVQVTDNAPGSPQTVALTGTGVTPTAGISLSPTSLTFASQTVGTSSAPQTITVSNPGSGNLVISSVVVSGDYSQTNNCTTVAPAGTCTVNVTFTPTAAGTRTGVLTLTDNAAGSPHTAPLTGVGAGIPNISFNPTSLTFPTTPVGTTSAAQSTTVTNNGGATLTITSIALRVTDTLFNVSANTCGGTLAVGATCTVSVTFSPTSVGTFGMQLNFTDNAAGSPQAVPGTASSTQSSVSLFPTTMAFGSVAVSTTSSVISTRLTNTGTSTLTISSITLTGTNPGDFLISSNTCGPTVAPSAFCDVGVVFSPTTTGARSANLSFADNAPTSPQAVALTGTGTAPAISFVPTSLNFGQVAVGASSLLSTTLTNNGGAPLLISGISMAGANPTSFSQTNTCGASVAAGGNCTITVTFNPQATGALSASVVVVDNAAGSPHTVPLQGTGTQGIASFSPTSIGFGNQAVGTTSAPLTTTLTNSGTASFSISSISLTGSAYFTISSNNCGATLAASASCAISVTFTPAITGTASGAIVVTDTAPGSPQSVPLTGTGTGTPFVSFVPASLSFPNTAVGVASAALTTTLKNTGTANLTGVSISITGTNAADYTQTNNCGTTVIAAGSCTINVTFTPSANGSRTANVQVVDSLGTQTVPLAGTGFTPTQAVSLSTTSISFGNQTNGTQSNPQVVVVTNVGTATLTVNTATLTGTNPGDFGFTTTCGATLAVSASCSYSIHFTPTHNGSRSATFNVNTNAASSPNTVSLSGIGNGSPPGGQAPQAFSGALHDGREYGT